MADHLNKETRVPNAPGKEDAPVKAPEAPKPDEGTFKVAELRNDGAVIEMDDGRMFVAAIADGVELRKRNTVSLKFAERDKDGVPVDATVTKVL